MKYFLGVLTLSAQVWASEGKIKILPESFVQGPTIQLGEIATFDNLSANQVAKIKYLKLADAPSFGEARSFSSQALAELLRAKIKDNGLQLQIPSTVVVKSKSSKIDTLAIKNRITEGVKQTCGECEILVRDIVIPAIDSTPNSSWDLTPDWTQVRGSFQIPLEVTDDVGKKNTFWIMGKVILTRNVVVMRRSLLYGERIQAQDIEIQKRDVTYKPDCIIDPKEAVGAQTKAPLSANSLLTRSQFQRQPALVRGQSVTITAKETGWNISVKGIAEENGFVGDLVKVSNPFTKKVVMGTVIAEGVVEVK